MPLPQTMSASPRPRDTKTPPDPQTCKPTDAWKRPLGGILNLDCQGIVHDGRVKLEIIPNIAHGLLSGIHAIIVHQTNSPTAKSTLNAYRANSGDHRVGAHFLIDRDGQVYQTAPLNRRCWHIAPIRSRCWETHHTCPTPQNRQNLAWEEQASKKIITQRQLQRLEARPEYVKPYPLRFPTNDDAIGIEIVGQAITKYSDGRPIPSNKVKDYEPLTKEEQESLDWLIPALLSTLRLQKTDVYRHPQVGYKVPGEAASASF